ncbi:putative methylthioribose kinase-like [Capsicum annuum]|nr:putative methylthioribose kinase-like [Capsicum annuum]
MANLISFLTSLLIILAILTLKIHAVNYTVTNRAANTPGGVRSNIASKQWKLPLPQDFPAVRKNVQKVSMFVDDMDGIACSSNNEIHVLVPEIYHWSTVPREHPYLAMEREYNERAPGGLIEGIADYVRLKAGYAPSNWVKLGQGDRWDQGYDVIARFLDYCNSLKRRVVAQLNKKMRTGYSDQFFVDLLEKTIDQLWRDYKAKFRA